MLVYCPYLSRGQRALINLALSSTGFRRSLRSPLSTVGQAAAVNWSWAAELLIPGCVQAETGCPPVTQVIVGISALSRRFGTPVVPKHGWTTDSSGGIQKGVHLFIFNWDFWGLAKACWIRISEGATQETLICKLSWADYDATGP